MFQYLLEMSFTVSFNFEMNAPINGIIIEENKF